MRNILSCSLRPTKNCRITLFVLGSAAYHITPVYSRWLFDDIAFFECGHSQSHIFFNRKTQGTSRSMTLDVPTTTLIS